MDLKEVREKIDTIDEKIADLFAARMDEVERVTEIKKANNLPVYSPAREPGGAQQGVRPRARKIRILRAGALFHHVRTESLLSKQAEREFRA